MSMIRKMAIVVTAVDIGVAVANDSTPFLGGLGRNATYEVPAPLLTATVLLQGAPKDASGNEPAEGDASWTTIATLTATSDPIGEFELPDFLRLNCTVLDADGPACEVFIRGVQ